MTSRWGGGGVLPVMANAVRLCPKGNLSFGSVKGAKRANRLILWLCKVEETFKIVTDSHLKDSAFTAVKRDAKF